MNLHKRLVERAAQARPVTVGLIGAGKFGSMFLTQVRSTEGMHLVGLADLMPDRAKERLTTCGWSREQSDAKSIGEALKTGKTLVTDDAISLVAHGAIEVIIEATGDPTTGIGLCLTAIEHAKHIIMVNVEADAVAGPLLARKAQEKGSVYSLAWGDQPALICEHVDWARACGFKVVAAGKGTRYHPTYHQSTPDTVWEILDKYLAITDRKSINPKMFNSFLDGTKSGIEMTAVCNATGLLPQSEGLGFPPATRFELAQVCKPKTDGGALEKSGVTEVVSSLYRDGKDVPYNLALGTYVVFEGDTDYARRCFREYDMLPDKSGRYASNYRPIHMIGLELGISVASVALRREPTGSPIAFNSDVIATAKRNLKKGEILDGEGGFCVWGKQTPAQQSLDEQFLPLGLAHNIKLKTDVAQGQRLKWADVEFDSEQLAVRIRREMERTFGRPKDKNPACG
jgi:predicted homoserine dehydrogenase-like protein